ncbi:MAG: S-layer homology domain-containing protein [Thermomicrobiales bacterium]
MMKYRRWFPAFHGVLIGVLIGQIFVASFHPASVVASSRSAKAQASAPSPASSPSLSVNRAGTTTIPPSGIVALIATLEADAGLTLASLEASSSPDGPWQTLGTYATPGPITVTTGFDITATAYGGSTAPGPRAIVVRATDSAGGSSTVTLPLVFDNELDSFTDIGNSPYQAAIRQLATRGVIKGYGDGRFGPNDPTLRAQMAALIARAMGWDLEDYGNNFIDRQMVNDALWRNVGTLGHYQVAFGYDGSHFGPNDAVLRAQVISFITRGMVALGYWQFQQPNFDLYPNIPHDSGHQRDLATYVHYVGAVPETTLGHDWVTWTGKASRAWFAQALWQLVQWRENAANWLIIQPPAIASPSDGVAVRASTADRQPTANGSVTIGGLITEDMGPLSGIPFAATIAGQGLPAPARAATTAGRPAISSSRAGWPGRLRWSISRSRASGRPTGGGSRLAPTGGRPALAVAVAERVAEPERQSIAEPVAGDAAARSEHGGPGDRPHGRDRHLRGDRVPLHRAEPRSRPASRPARSIRATSRSCAAWSASATAAVIGRDGRDPRPPRVRADAQPGGWALRPRRQWRRAADGDAGARRLSLGAAAGGCALARLCPGAGRDLDRARSAGDDDRPGRGDAGAGGAREPDHRQRRHAPGDRLLPAGDDRDAATAGRRHPAAPPRSMRATEYTVGANGPTAMPAPLPPTSGYTYAAEFSVDEALAAGATGVQFSQPLPVYLENFLAFPVGTIAPVGFYDRAKGQWIPALNGLVVKIVGVTGGRADLDLDGDGNADDGAALGITDAERAQLASLYAVGQSLWRVPISHFSAWDSNWPFGPPPDAAPPMHLLEQDRLQDFEDTARERELNERLKQQLKELANTMEDIEKLPEPAQERFEKKLSKSSTSMRATYSGPRPGQPRPAAHLSPKATPERAHPTGRRGRRTPLRKRSRQWAHRRLHARHPADRGDAPERPQRVELEIAVAGQRFTQSFAPSANLHYTFTWDGRDAYGRLLQGVQPVTVRVGYVYTGQYYEPGVRNPAFASPPEGVVLATDRERLEITLWQTSNGTIGLFDWLPQGLGGWSLSDHHVYDPNRGIIYLGDGTTRSVAALNTRATLLVPGSNEGVAGGAANPAGLLIRPDGGLLIAYEHTIVLVRTDGTSEVIAGTGETGDGGDGGPATEAQLTDAVALALGPDGSLYIADRGAHRVRRVAPDGTIGAVLPTGAFGFSGDGGPATQAMFYDVRGVVAAPDGSVSIADTDASGIGRVRRVGTDGLVATVAGGGAVDADGVAINAILNGPVGIALGTDGSIFIAEDQRCRVRRVGTDGMIGTVAGMAPARSARRAVRRRSIRSSIRSAWPSPPMARSTSASRTGDLRAAPG